MQKTYNFAEKIRERVWMLWWQIKSDIREATKDSDTNKDR